MKRLWTTILTGICLLASFTGVQAATVVLSVDDAIEQALAKSDLAEELRLTVAQFQISSGIPDAAYDPVLYGSLIQDIDRSEQLFSFYGDKTLRMLFEGGVRKLFDTGTYLDAKLGHTRSESFYPPSPAPKPLEIEIPLPGGAPLTVTLPSAGGFSNSAFLPINPAYETRLEVTLNQSLTRNLLSRQLEIQKELILANVPDIRYGMAMQAQGLAAAVEGLYIQLQSLDARAEVIREGLALLDEMDAINRRKMAYGRAEKKDLISVQAARLGQEKILVNLEGARRSLEVQLAEHLRLPYGTELAVTPLTAVEIPVPPPLETLMERAHNRFDLKIQDNAVHKAKLEVDKTRTDALPDVNAFVGVRSNGLEGTFGDSFTDVANDTDHISFNIGIKAEWTFGPRRAVAAARANAETASRLAKLKKKRILRGVERDLEAASVNWQNTAENLKALAAREAALKRLIEEENRLYQQARSDAAIVIGHKQELVGLHLERVEQLSAFLQARNAIRIATQSYPLPTVFEAGE